VKGIMTYAEDDATSTSDATEPNSREPSSTGPGIPHRSARTRQAVVISLGLDLAAPLAVFYGLRAAGVSAWGALLASAVVPILVVIGRFTRYRTMDFGALFVLTLLTLGLVLSALTGSPRALLVRDAWLGLSGGVAGIWLIGSAFYGRPGLFVVFRSFVLAKAGPQGLASWEGRWDVDERDFRRNLRLLTVVWGAALLLSAVAQLIVAYAAPIDVAPAAMNVVWPVIAVPLWAFHIVFTKRRDLRA
jgi:hypothetical protein